MSVKTGSQFNLPGHQRGVNLIEIMVAMAIGLFLVLGATTLYVNSRKTANIDDDIARLQETARYALSVIETDVRMANYWGMKKDGSDFENKDRNLRLPTGTSAGALSASTATNYCGSVAAANGSTYVSNTEAYVEATNDNYGFSCTANTSAVASADTLTVRRAATASITTPAATQLAVCSTRKTATLTKGSTTCANGEFHNLIVNGYYIDQGSSSSTSYPSLRRKTLIVGPAFDDVEIIPGIEDMQVEFGWDNSSTDSAGVVRYVQPGDAVLASGRIVAVRVWLLVRAERSDTAFNDTRTYSYANRTGTATTTLTAGRAYAPTGTNSNFRRLLVSRTFFIRNVTGT